MKSTKAMRDRIRELMPKAWDDYDRAVDCVLEDIEQLEAALRGIIQTLESLNDTKRASFYRGSVVNELTVSLDLARAALEQEK